MSYPAGAAIWAHAVSALFNFFRKFEENIAACFMGALLLVLFLQVFTRYVLNDPLSWTEEAARYIYVYIVFLGASAAISDRSHVGIDVFAKMLPCAAQWVAALLINLIIVVVLLNLVWWGWIAARRQWNLPLVVLEIPYTWVYIIIPVTAALMTVRTLVIMCEDFRKFRAGENVISDARSGI
jgi:TRAP-type C4-dicarboxylate transport system permease small subunit